MVKVLKDMLYNLHKTAPNSVREFILAGFLMFENKFSLVLCDSPKGYMLLESIVYRSFPF
ncbi:hypothetical protein BD770DRAFT_429731 [Pilaira anomala]|nr:hypothetical protein BD770DRAFT_429731 [Pilaira anomala]